MTERHQTRIKKIHVQKIKAETDLLRDGNSIMEFSFMRFRS